MDCTAKKKTQAAYCEISETRVWLYSRVGKDGNSVLDLQRQRLESYAAKQGWKVTGVTSEIRNGLDLMRPGIAELIRTVEDGRADVILITDLSRLVRSTESTWKWCEYLRQKGVRLCTVDNGEVNLNEEISFRDAIYAAVSERSAR